METDILLERERVAKLALEMAKTNYMEASHSIRMEIGQELRKLREDMGLTREALAGILGVNRQTIFCSEHPEKAKRWFSTERLLEIHAGYTQVQDLRLPKITKGRAK